MSVDKQKSSGGQSTPPLKPSADQPIHIIKSETSTNPFTDTTQNTKSADIKTETLPKQTWPKSVSASNVSSSFFKKNTPAAQNTSAVPIEIKDSQKSIAIMAKDITTEQGNLENTVTVEPITQNPSPTSLLYESLQNKVQKNPPAFYSMIKKRSFDVNQNSLANELTTIANNKQTIVYLSPALIKKIMKTFGFTQNIKIHDRWTITTPATKVQLELVNDTVARLAVDTNILTNNSSFQAIPTLNTTSTALALPQMPPVVFSLPVPTTKTLTIEKNNIVAIKPAQVETLLVDFFFKLLKKGQKIERERTSAAQKSAITEPRLPEKISPAMQKILNQEKNKPSFTKEPFKIPDIQSSSKKLLPEWIQKNNPKFPKTFTEKASNPYKNTPTTINIPQVKPPLQRPNAFLNVLPKKFPK